MKNMEIINADDFMSMYVAVSFLQEQRYFNIDSIKNYLQTFCEANNASIDQLDSVIIDMVKAKIIEKVPNCDSLYKISKRVPFKEIIYSNPENLNAMINFFYNYQDLSLPSIKLISTTKSDVLKK